MHKSFIASSKVRFRLRGSGLNGGFMKLQCYKLLGYWVTCIMLSTDTHTYTSWHSKDINVHLVVFYHEVFYERSLICSIAVSQARVFVARVGFEGTCSYQQG